MTGNRKNDIVGIFYPPSGRQISAKIMYQHHFDSIQKLKTYFSGKNGVIALILGGSVVKGNARPDSDLDAIVVVTEEMYARLEGENRLAEVVRGFCTYEGGYFDVKYKTKGILKRAAECASEPTRNAFEKAQVLFSSDPEIEPLVHKIEQYPVWQKKEKLACFSANLKLNSDYFFHCTGKDNAYMRAHLAQEIVYSVYRLILLENELLFPCNRRLEETVRRAEHRPEDILELGRVFLENVSEETCEAFIGAFKNHTRLAVLDDVSECCSHYVHYYEDWWMCENPPFPNEW